MNDGSSPEGEVSVVESPEGAQPAEESSSVNWEDFNDSFNEEVDDVEKTVEGDVAIAQPEMAEAKAVPETVPETAAATIENPAKTPEQPEPVTPPTVEGQKTPSAEEYQTWRNQRLTELEQQYALDEAAASAALTEPETVLPKLAAKVHLEVLESSMRAVQAMLPAMMQQMQAGTALNERAKGLFASVNPDLADPQYEGAILQFGQLYRSMNRTAPPEEAARAIGNLVRSAYGLVPSMPAPTQQTVAPVATPFIPVRGGGSAGRPLASVNPFEQMAAEFEMEDRN